VWEPLDSLMKGYYEHVQYLYTLPLLWVKSSSPEVAVLPLLQAATISELCSTFIKVSLFSFTTFSGVKGDPG